MKAILSCCTGKIMNWYPILNDYKPLLGYCKEGEKNGEYTGAEK